MNASRNGSAARAIRTRQIGKRDAERTAVTDAPGGSAAVVGERDGSRHVVVLCASEEALSCGRETTRSQSEITSRKLGEAGKVAWEGGELARLAPPSKRSTLDASPR